MGWVLMSERDLNRLEVLAQIDDGRLSVGNGANVPVKLHHARGHYPERADLRCAADRPVRLIRRCRLQTDRPLLLVRPKSLRPTRHHAPTVPTIPSWTLSITLCPRQCSDAGRLH